jgi:beta-lactamase superfamily II metal-dependent hydrolase
VLNFTLFDVGHGFCAYATVPTGRSILFDCGYDNQLEFFPSRYFRDRNITRIDRLILSHFDQDHVCDLPDLRQQVMFGSITRNPSVPADFIQSEKRSGGVITSAMASAIEMHRDWTDPVTEPDWGGLEITTFYNNYPIFKDMNNLSLVTFLNYGNSGIVIPGDLEGAGWEALLEQSSFRSYLGRTNIFVASHHGREAEYSPEVFKFCTPSVIILSDKGIVHESQDHDYAKHASGITWNTTQTRRVLTTRCDGHIQIKVQPTGGFYIETGVTL